jgi:hypothetical protein
LKSLMICLEKRKKRNKYLKWLLYGCLFLSFYILLTPSGGRLLDILIRGIPGVLAFTIAICLQKYKLALLAIVSLCLNMGWVYIYPKYVTPVVKRRAALEKERHNSDLGDGAKVNIIYHSEDIAAKRAVEFVDICLIKQDFVAGPAKNK